MSIQIQKPTLLVVLGVFSILTISISIAVPALALKRYFNSTTRAANKDGELSEDEVNTCNYMILAGATKYYVNESSPLS
jgi:hypothetical protein